MPHQKQEKDSKGQAGRVSKSQGGKTSGVPVARPEELTAAKTVDEIGGLG